jgi:hypothetical protein
MKMVIFGIFLISLFFLAAGATVLIVWVTNISQQDEQ